MNAPGPSLFLLVLLTVLAVGVPASCVYADAQVLRTTHDLLSHRPFDETPQQRKVLLKGKARLAEPLTSLTGRSCGAWARWVEVERAYRDGSKMKRTLAKLCPRSKETSFFVTRLGHSDVHVSDSFSPVLSGNRTSRPYDPNVERCYVLSPEEVKKAVDVEVCLRTGDDVEVYGCRGTEPNTVIRCDDGVDSVASPPGAGPWPDVREKHAVFLTIASVWLTVGLILLLHLAVEPRLLDLSKTEQP